LITWAVAAVVVVADIVVFLVTLSYITYIVSVWAHMIGTGIAVPL